MLVSWNWLKEYIGETNLTAQQAADLLGYHAFEIEEIEEKGGDTVIDVDILPNRSSDCLCQRGVAREIASIMDAPLAHDPLTHTPELTPTSAVQVHIADTEACPRFTASLVTGITVKESPDWLKKRLEAIGQRPINNIVDATNYVMFAIGQPIHAYDADLFPQVDGAWQFGVRYAQEGEVVSLIAEGGKDEDRDVTLSGSELLIVDESSDTPIGLAGVKGGRFAGVHDGTTKIIIEAAHFHPTITRKTARCLGIVIDASKRFENEPSRELPSYAQSEIVKLILDIAGGSYEGTLDTYLEKKENQPVRVNSQQVNALLGLSLSVGDMASILRRVGCEVSTKGETLIATGPWERTDLNIEADFIEEIGRIYGYDHVESVVPEAVPLGEMNVRHYYSEKVRDVLIALGFSEVITSSFRKKDKIKLRNALASDKGCLRSTLSKNITEALDKNVGFVDLLGATDTRVFEIGTVFHKKEPSKISADAETKEDKGGGIAEHVSLALGVRTKHSGYNQKDDKVTEDAIAALETKLGTKLDVTLDKAVAEVNFTEVFESLPVPETYDAVEVADEIIYQPFSTFQHMTRDIAMWVEEGTTVEVAQKVLDDAAGELRVRTTHVDEFTKDGRTSLAFRLVFQAQDRTLTDEEVNAQMDKVYKAAEEQGWETR